MPFKRDKMFTKIGEDLTVMSAVVFKQMQYIREQLETESVDYKDDEINNNELILDGLEVKIRRNVTNAMVLYGPRAAALRRMMSCYDICMSLERMGDLLRNVHKHLVNVNFNSTTFREVKPLLLKAYSTMETMVANAINSYSNEDSEQTQATIDLDDVVDALYGEIREKLIAISSDHALATTEIREILSISDLSYNIERIADYSVNIIESSIYLIEGKNVQHTH